MRDPNLLPAPQAAKFCQPITDNDAPLRIRQELAEHALADPEFKQVPTEDLLYLARTRKRVYVTDRASAIAALKGVVNVGGKVGPGGFVRQ